MGAELCWRQIALATKLCAVAPNIFGPSVWDWLHGAKSFNLLAPELFFLILTHSVYKM